MTTSPKLYGEYINPTNEQYSIEKENPLLLMAQACQNIDKELNSLSSSYSFPSKLRKSNSPTEGKKSLKRTIPSSSISSATKKMFIPQSSSLMFDPRFNQHRNKTFSLPSFDFSSLLNYSTFSPTFAQSSYLMDSILSSPFVCNWIDAIHPNGFCGKRFTNHFHFLEHLCTEHSSIQSSYLSSFPSTSIEKI